MHPWNHSSVIRYGDIHDGSVWKTFGKKAGGTGFFSESNSHIGLQLNVDWLQPFDSR